MRQSIIALAFLVDQLVFVCQQFFDQVIDFAGERAGDIAAAIPDAVVGNAILREIIGADLLAAVAGADQLLTGCG